MADGRKKLRFVTGMHRSGTTWLGRAIAASCPGSVVHEPFNAHAGLEGVDAWYPGLAAADLVCERTSAMLDGKARFRRVRKSDGFLKGAVRRLVGSSYDRDLARALRGPHKAIVLKDPFVIRASQALCESFSAKGVVLVRHPAALLSSLNRMGWPVPTLSPEGWERRYEQQELQFAFELGQFWAALYGELGVQLAACGEDLIVVRHEDLCLSPIETGARVFAHLELAWTEAARRYLEDSTSGELGEASGDQLHQMHRSGERLAFSWRNSLSRAKIEVICDAASPTLRQYYPDGL